eukprot:GEMP01007666.1.p2 GENE.GEMP01007666.1~~GEMP01007666.1.p2  ORF type:complete len:163 (-),score=23.99 GEMP01007666.1:1312-1800(-)
MKPTSTANKFSQLSCSHFGYHANIKFAIVSPIALVQIQKGLHPTRSINSPAIGEHTAITTVTELAISPAATAGSSTESGKCDNRNGMTVTFKNGNALADTLTQDAHTSQNFTSNSLTSLSDTLSLPSHFEIIPLRLSTAPARLFSKEQKTAHTNEKDTDHVR